MPLPIEDYALIGDCQTAALCRPRRLDRLAVLAPLRFRCLLRGAARHRRERALADRAARPPRRASRRRYRADTLILETRFETDEGAVTLVDFMPMGATNSERRPARRRRARPGDDVAASSILRFGYGAIVPWVTRLDDGTLRAVAGPGHGGAAHAGQPCAARI